MDLDLQFAAQVSEPSLDVVLHRRRRDAEQLGDLAGGPEMAGRS